MIRKRRSRIRRPVGRPRGSRDLHGAALPVPALRNGARAAWQYAYERVAVAVGHELRQTRQAQGVSVDELAAAVGVSANAVHQYERGRCVPHLARLVQLAWALGLDPGSLLGGVVNSVGRRPPRHR